MNRTIISRTTAIAALSLAFVSTVYAADSIKVGVVTPLSGSYAPIGKQVRWGAELAVKEINAAGGVNGRPFELSASLAKLFSGEVSRRVVNEAVQIHGGYGFMDEYPVSRMYRDQKINEIGEGTNEVQRLVIARQIGL